MHRNGLPDDSPRWAVMPARPLCFGRKKRDTPACRICLWGGFLCYESHGVEIRSTWRGADQALLRVYARENRELRAEVERLRSDRDFAAECFQDVCESLQVPTLDASDAQATADALMEIARISGRIVATRGLTPQTLDDLREAWNTFVHLGTVFDKRNKEAPCRP